MIILISCKTLTFDVERAWLKNLPENRALLKNDAIDRAIEEERQLSSKKGLTRTVEEGLYNPDEDKIYADFGTTEY